MRKIQRVTLKYGLGHLTLACFKAGVALANNVHFAFSADNLTVAVSFFLQFSGRRGLALFILSEGRHHGLVTLVELAGAAFDIDIALFACVHGVGSGRGIKRKEGILYAVFPNHGLPWVLAHERISHPWSAPLS